MARRSGSTPTAGSRPAAGTRRWRHSRTWWPPRERCGMEAAEIRITAEPIDNQRCKFVVSVPVWAGGVRRFTDADEAKGSPLAEAIFAIPGLAVSDLDRQPTLQVCRERPGVGWWSTPIHGC